MADIVTQPSSPEKGDEHKPISLGISCYFSGKFSEAAAHFTQATKDDPKNYKAFDYLAAALDCLGSTEKAKHALQNSLSLRDTASALNSMGALFISERKDHKAIPFFECALELQPNSYIFAMNLGDSLRRTNQGRDAAVAYRIGLNAAKRALETGPKDNHLHAYIGYFLARLGEDRKEAASKVIDALNLCAADGRVIRRAVLTYVAMEEYDRAQELLATADLELQEDLKRHPDFDNFPKERAA